MWLTELPPYLQQIQLFNTLTHSYKHLNKCSPLPINNGVMAFLLALPSLLLLRPNTFLEAVAVDRKGCFWHTGSREPVQFFIKRPVCSAWITQVFLFIQAKLGFPVLM